jgi:ATP-dependent Zn protease
MDETLDEMTCESNPTLFISNVPGAYAERRRHSEATARKIDTAERELVHIAYKRASKVMTKHHGDLEGQRQVVLGTGNLVRRRSARH